MKFCTTCGVEIDTRDGENMCPACDAGLTAKKKAAAKEARAAREEALRSCGLKKVKGALGGTYWE